MEHMDRQHSSPRSAGPFVTTSGRRLPVRTLSFRDVEGLIEFSDHLARRFDAPRVLGFDRSALELMTESEFDARIVIGIMAGPRSLIRGVGSYERTPSAASADVSFTVDDSLLPDGVFREMVYRVADHAREHQVKELRAAGAGAGAEHEAFEASGFPCTAIGTPGQGMLIDITEPR